MFSRIGDFFWRKDCQQSFWYNSHLFMKRISISSSLLLIMSKQNQLHEQLYRPFPHENPECKAHDNLSLDSNCICPPCKSRPENKTRQICLDQDLEALRQKRVKSKTSDFVVFLSEIYKYASVAVPNLPILDTVVFNHDGSVKFIVNYDSGKLKFSKLTTTLKNYLSDRKYVSDLQFQKKKFQREHLGFSFTQLDHQSEKYIKQFENNIKYMNPLLNRVAISKIKQKEEEEILSHSEITSMFAKISRKLFDFSNMEYLQVFPVMYGHEESSYVKKVKYFREKEIRKKNFKIAEHYVGNWYSKNETLQNMEQDFINSIKDQQDQMLMYFAYKLFIFYQRVSNKMVECALLSFITNDEGNTFYLKNVDCLSLFNLHEVGERTQELPRKLENTPDSVLNLRQEMKNNFNLFQRNYQRLQRQRKDLQDKRQSDINFSNRVYESLGNTIPKYNQSSSFIKSIFQEHSTENRGKIVVTPPSESSKQL